MPVHAYPFNILEIPIGNYLIKIAQLKNPEILFDELLKNNFDHPDLIDERIPYWSELWPSAIALSEYIFDNPDLANGKEITEIGCGLGLPGIVAAKIGGNVTLTDYLPAALEFAEYNWDLNFSSKANTRFLDWRNPADIIPADVLLASDVAYERRNFNPLLKSFNLLVKKDGLILISEPNRKFAKEFFTEIKNAGFVITEEIRIISKDGIQNKISVFLLRH